MTSYYWLLLVIAIITVVSHGTKRKSSARQLGARGVTNAVLGVDPSNEMLRRGVVKAGRHGDLSNCGVVETVGWNKGFSPSKNGKNGNVPCFVPWFFVNHELFVNCGLIFDYFWIDF